MERVENNTMRFIPLEWNRMFTINDVDTIRNICSIDTLHANEELSLLLWGVSRTDCCDVWRKLLKYLVHKRGTGSNQTYWAVCKETALDFLELRDDAVVAFNEIHEELSIHYREVCDDILLKLQLLKRFESVYNRQPHPVSNSHQPPPEKEHDSHESHLLEPETDRGGESSSATSRSTSRATVSSI